MIEITFEEVATPQRFAHIRSDDGLVGHAQEIRDQVPLGTWLTVQPALQRAIPWVTKNCGFKYMGALVVGDEVHELLLRED